MTGAQAAARRAWRNYLRRYREYRASLALSVALLSAQSMLYASLAFAVKAIFDDILQKKPLAAFLGPTAAILFIITCSGLLSRAARQRVLAVIKITIAGLRRELLDKSYALGNHFASATDRSRLHSLIVHDTERVDVMSYAAVAIALPALLTGSVLCVVLLVLAPSLLLVVAFVGSLSLIVNRYMGGKLKTWAERFNAAFEAFSQGILAAMQRMELTRAMGEERTEKAQRAVQIDTVRQVSARMAMAATTYNIAQTYVTALVTLSVLLVGGSHVLSGRIGLGALAAAYVVVVQLASALSNLWNAIPPIISGYKSLVDIDETLSKSQIAPQGGTKEQTLLGAILLDGVQFSYGDRPVLTNLTLKVAPGERVAIMGPNGAGKSTLLSLLLGIHESQRGSILLDGTPLAELSQEFFRRQIGIVLQEQQLLAGTVAENIACGRAGVAFPDIIRAAQAAGADAFIRALPQGYDTMIGAQGASLSGGQSQLVAVARALLGRPKLLLLDEPTNHLDRDTAAALCLALQTLEFQPTILLITHDTATAAGFGRVCRLQNGELIETVSAPSDRISAAAPKLSIS